MAKMKPFTSLTYSGQVKRLKKLAKSALLNYNFGDIRLVCLGHGENTTFKVEIFSHPSSQAFKKADFCYVLRIYRPGKQNFAAINSELLWLRSAFGSSASLSLRHETDLSVSEPVAASDGSLIVMADAPGVPEARYCVLFRWLPGKFLDAGLNAKAIMRVGIFLARLHQYSQNFIPPKGFVRSQLNEDRLFGSLPLLLPAKSQAVLETAAKKIRQQMRCITKAPEFFGLIHGDLNFSNCKFHQGEIQVFDFDDCGWGYYIYDVAVTLYYLRNRSDFQFLREVLLKSYQQIRALPQQHVSCLDALIAARRLHLLRDLLQRQDHPKLRELTPKYIENSVEEMKQFLHKSV